MGPTNLQKAVPAPARPARPPARPSSQGTSLGGYIATALAAAHGDRVGKVIVGPGSAGSPNSLPPDADLVARRVAGNLSDAEYLAELFPLDLPQGGQAGSQGGTLGKAAGAPSLQLTLACWMLATSRRGCWPRWGSAAVVPGGSLTALRGRPNHASSTVWRVRVGELPLARSRSLAGVEGACRCLYNMEGGVVDPQNPEIGTRQAAAALTFVSRKARPWACSL